MTNEKVFAMSVGKVWPLLVAKVERKGRTEGELEQAACWLTGYSLDGLRQAVESGMSYREFFENAPCINPRRELITGSICGINLSEIEDPLMQNIRYLDKLADDIAKGKPMEKVLRGDRP